MKDTMKYGTLAFVMLVCLPHYHTTSALNIGNRELTGGEGVIAVVTLLGIGYTAGKYFGQSPERIKEEYKLKQLQLEKEHAQLEKEHEEKIKDKEEQAKEFTKKQQIKLFHQIEEMKKTVHCFERFIKQYTNPEYIAGQQQHQQVFREMIALAGSIQSFEKRLQKHLADYETFDPEQATNCRDTYQKLIWVQRALHTNSYVSEQKKIEEEQYFERSRKEAQLKKVQHEAQTAQNLEISSNKIISTTTELQQMARVMQQESQKAGLLLVHQVDAIQALIQKSLQKTSKWQSNHDQEYKTVIQKLDDQQKEVQDLKKQVASKPQEKNQAEAKEASAKQQQIIEKIEQLVAAMHNVLIPPVYPNYPPPHIPQ